MEEIKQNCGKLTDARKAKQEQEDSLCDISQPDFCTMSGLVT